MTQVVTTAILTAGVVSQVSGRIIGGSLDLALSAAGGLARILSSSVARLSEHPKVREELTAMDIEAKVRSVQALLLSVRRRRRASGAVLEAAKRLGDDDSMVIVAADAMAARDVEDETDVVDVCLAQVGEALEAITATLEKVNTELALHETRWLSTWRNPDTTQLMVDLKAQVAVLDGRVDFLLKCHQAFFVVAPPA